MAYSWTSLLDWLNAISPIVAALANIVLMAATIFLAKYTKGLWDATSEYGKLVQKQTEIMKDQLSANAAQTDNLKKQTEIMNDQLDIAKEQTKSSKHQSEIMDKQIMLAESQNEIIQEQVSFLREQNKILKEQSERNAKIEKYRRLLDEMENLIMPLHFAAETKKLKDDNFFDFHVFHPKNRSNPVFEQKVSLWDGIKKHLYLSSSGHLVILLNQFFDDLAKYYNNPTGDFSEYIEITVANIIKETSEIFPRLSSEICELETDLGIKNENVKG
jgi:hypothetical protein